MNIKTYSIKNRNTSPSSRKRLIFIIAAIAALVAAVIIFLATTHYGNIIGTKASDTTTNNQATKGEPSGDTSGEDTDPVGNPAPGTGADDKQNGQAGTTPSGQPPVQPSGNFTSNYMPSLSATGAKELIQSVCTTTPGATCVINFTKGDTTKSLEKRTTDKGGSVYWTWKLKDLGLTEGSWKITATAELNGQKVSTTDTLPLEVEQ